MTFHQTRTTTGELSPPSSHAGQNNIKKLRSKYDSKLAIIKELFENWSDEDLLFAIQDADGNMELAIERISEGHAVQWGEVKSKKSKKEALQKAKGAPQRSGYPFSSSASQRVQYHSSPSHSERGEKLGRGGSRGVRGSGKKTQQLHSLPHQTNATSWAKQSCPSASAQHSDLNTASSWASIASALKPATDDTPWTGQDQNSTAIVGCRRPPDAATTTNIHSWGTPSRNDETRSPTTDYSNPSTANSASSPSPRNYIGNRTTSLPSEPKKTWASLLRPKPKLEQEVKEVQLQAVEDDSRDLPTAGIKGRDAPVAELNDNNEGRKVLLTNSAVNDPWDTPASDDSWDFANKEPDTPQVPENDSDESPWLQNTSKVDEGKQDVPPMDEKKEESKDVNDEPIAILVVPDTAPVDKEEAASPQLDTYSPKPKHTARRLKQDVAVILPTMANTSFSAIDLRFGSLSLDDSSTKQVVQEARPDKQESELPNEGPLLQQHSQTEPHPANTPAREEHHSVLSVPEIMSGQSSYLKQQQQRQNGPSISYMQQQQYGTDYLTSAYSSYIPTQQQTGVSGFSMNPITLPEFGVYDKEAQRAAGAMGYYGTSGYKPSPTSTATSNAYQTQDTFGQQEVPQSAGSVEQTRQAIPHPQQMYSASAATTANLPYYHYYYMTNGFGGYQQNTYGEPLFNKNVYPSVYQQMPGKSAAGPPFGAAVGGSPYQGQHLYSQTGGYDDMAPLQQQIATVSSGELHEYHQKPSSYGSGPGLSNLSGLQQQQHPHGAQVDQQQQQQQHAPGLRNYFNDPQSQHMFYAQQHMHQQQFPMQYNPQQPQPGLQQYWTQ